MLRIIALKQNLTLRSLFHRCNVNNISRNKNYTIVGIINNNNNNNTMQKFLTTMTKPCKNDNDENDSNISDDPYLGKVVEIEVMDGEPDPVIKDVSEYPDWLWKHVEDQPSLQDLTRKYNAGKDLSIDELGRIVKLTNRTNIKSNNESSDIL